MKQNELGLLQSAASSHDFTFRNCQVLWGGGGGGGGIQKEKQELQNYSNTKFLIPFIPVREAMMYFM